MTSRFAIYAVPGVRPGEHGTPGAVLRGRAERWLGRGVGPDPVEPGVPAGWSRPAIDAITVDARRYGFHATLKPPFPLAAGRTPEELDAAVARFAAGHAGAVIRTLTLGRLGGFFALVPGEEDPALNALADDVVRAFDRFRAPPTEAELERRHRAGLTARQRELLGAWGYPYVLEEFRCHLTLTDRIPPPRREEVERVLRDWFAPSLGADVPVDALAVFAESEPGAPFRLHAVHDLQPAAADDGSRASPTHSEGVR